MEVSPAQFAKMAQVSPSAVSQKAKKKTLVVNSAGRIDTDNPVNAAFLTIRKAKTAKLNGELNQNLIEKPQDAAPLPPKKEITQKEFAGLAGISAAAVCQKVKSGALKTNAQGLLDTENVTNARYLERRKIMRARDALKTPAKEKPQGGVQSGAITDLTLLEVAGLPAKEMLEMTMRQIVTKYPGLDLIEKYAKILKDFTLTAEKEQKMQEREGQLIRKDFVISQVFGFINTLAMQLDDFPGSCADRIISQAAAGGKDARGAVIQTMAHGIQAIMGGAIDSAVAALKGGGK